MAPKTKRIGEKTAFHTNRQDLAIENKNPNYDYSFRRMKDIEEGGGADFYGWEPIGVGNSDGETWQGPHGFSPRGATKTMRLQDVIACRRKKEISEAIKADEDEKYNAQVNLVRSATQRARGKLRQIDPGGNISVEGGLAPNQLKQRPGPTEKELSKED